MQLIYIFCLSHLLHIYALSAAGQIRQTEIGFFFSFGLGSAETLVFQFALISQCFGKILNDWRCSILAQKVVLLIGGVATHLIIGQRIQLAFPTTILLGEPYLVAFCIE